MYKIIKSFKGSPDGCRVIKFTKGEMIEESADFPQSLIDVALTENWAVVSEPAKKVIKKSAKKPAKK